MPSLCGGGTLEVLAALAAGFRNPTDPGLLCRLGRAAELNQHKNSAKLWFRQNPEEREQFGQAAVTATLRGL
jgi:hypothetical protein